MAFGQHDFESRYFRIDATSLQELPEISALDLQFDTSTPFQKKSLSDFLKVTSHNYWEPVDMAQALAKDSSIYTDLPQINYQKIASKEYGFSVSVNGSNSFDGTNAQGINNIAYKEMRSVYFCAPSGNAPTARGTRRVRGFLNSIW